jgi:translation initiation factor 1 (eIF-1/SUI1)
MKHVNKKRIDLSGDGASLRASPFESLDPVAYPQGHAPSKSPDSGAKTPPGAPETPSLTFHIVRTRKGGLPIATEKRPGGKIVTVIRNVSGDAESMLGWLKKKCGAGGVVREGAIELQGDHVKRLESMLTVFLK